MKLRAASWSKLLRRAFLECGETTCADGANPTPESILLLGRRPSRAPCRRKCSRGLTPAPATSGFASRYHLVSNSGPGLRPSFAPRRTKCARGLSPDSATSGLLARYQLELNMRLGSRPSPAPYRT